MSLTIREQYEQLEHTILSPRAVRASESKGRLRDEPQCPIRTDFQRDRDRIIHCKAFRRLKHKTQVFIDPEEDHFRTRLTHTLEVSQIARTISRALRLNEDLTEAIALGHDLGHTPFGHIGEQALDEVIREYVPDMGFRHSEQSLRVVDLLERGGRGLNLTNEVRDGILRHSKSGADLSLDTTGPRTLEGRVVKISDRVAYINHDIDDAVQAGAIQTSELPQDALGVLGLTHSKRIRTMVMDIVETSSDNGGIGMGDTVREATNSLKDFLYETVYGRDMVGVWEMRQAIDMLKALFRYYMTHPTELSARGNGDSRLPTDSYDVREHARVVSDYISGMTDRYAEREYIRCSMQ